MLNNELLKIENLNATADNKLIIKGLNLTINYGEIHVIMGKNGSGKSTLAKVISGHPLYKVIEGKIFLKNENITNEEPDVRSHKGIFLGFQYPIEVPGVSNIDFLRLAYNSKRKYLNKQELDPLAFFELVNEKVDKINMSNKFLDRHLNEGFSGGEKKKNEIVQMSLLDSELCILDEIDSGLDVDALKDIARNIKSFHNMNNSVLVITHYQRLIDYLNPDHVHVMSEGKITLSGDRSLALSIDRNGYESII